MNEYTDGFTPETIDSEIESPSESRLSADERRLVENLHACSQRYVRENERSIEWIWNRLEKSQGQWKESGERPMHAKEEKTMQEQPASSRQAPSPHPARRRSFSRRLDVGVAAAVTVLLIVSWALLLNVQRRVVTSATPLKVIHSGKLACSFPDGNVSGQPMVAWSSQGQIATVNHNLKTLSANCSRKLALQTKAASVSWSPDGSKLLVIVPPDTIQVLNGSSGKVLQSKRLAGSFILEAIWSSDGARIIFAASTSTGPGAAFNVMSFDARNSGNLQTHLKFATNWEAFDFSPNGQSIAVVDGTWSNLEFWSLSSGKRMGGKIPLNQRLVCATAWSPDGASIAVSYCQGNSVEIGSVMTGDLSGSFEDKEGANMSSSGGTLAWSPNGRYLAEGKFSLHIWDVKTQKMVVTLTKDDGNVYAISALAWSPDGAMLASSFMQHEGTAFSHYIVNVWAFS